MRRLKTKEKTRVLLKYSWSSSFLIKLNIIYVKNTFSHMCMVNNKVLLVFTASSSSNHEEKKTPDNKVDDKQSKKVATGNGTGKE